MKKEKKVLGRADVLDLPELSLTDVKVKIDTGAYTSAIHCSKIKEIEEDGAKYLTFRIPSTNVKGVKSREFKVKDFKRKNIKSSSGHIEKRFVIKTKVRIFSKTYLTEFSLADRSKMRFPILIGRKLLRNRFVIDVSKVNLSYKEKSKK